MSVAFAIVWGLLALISVGRSALEFRDDKPGQGALSVIFSVVALALSLTYAAAA
jgi:hypothetical protein